MTLDDFKREGSSLSEDFTEVSGFEIKSNKKGKATKRIEELLGKGRFEANLVESAIIKYLDEQFEKGK